MVLRGLAAAQVGHWVIPEAEGHGVVICVRESDRPAVAASLARRAGPAWFLEALDRHGVRSGTVRPMQQGGAPPVRSAPGWLAWEFVVPHPGSTFVADESHGVEILFWADTGSEVESRVSNLTAARLPAEQVTGFGRTPACLSARPIGRVGFPVDVVYTWVDGKDERWQRAKAEAGHVADPEAFTERALDEARFADHDELRYSLRALEQFAPWVNHVWIVTADQHPGWLDPGCDWISVVSHRQIWPDATGLPSFNSHAIEACLHRIPGLAEHFLYFNDDTLLGRPVPPELFFHPSGIGKFFASLALVDFGPPVPGEIASTSAAKNARHLLEERYGVTFSRKFFHTAAALTVSGLSELESLFPDAFARTRAAQFRTIADVAAAGSLYLNWGQVTGRLVPGQIRYTYVDPADANAERRLRLINRHRPFDTLCINDGTTEETVEQRQQTDRLIRRFFAEYLPVPGSFER